MALDVESVLRTRRFEAMLDQFAGDLEDQLEERKIIAEAKDLLQATQGITEEEAYSQLRLNSRRSRRRIFEVAHQLVKARLDASLISQACRKGQ
jgi:AmiR/NasT family two-component response regulator